MSRQKNRPKTKGEDCPHCGSKRTVKDATAATEVTFTRCKECGEFWTAVLVREDDRGRKTRCVTRTASERKKEKEKRQAERDARNLVGQKYLFDV